MDAPPIHYCRTDDGVNIAYWTVGEGVPVVELHHASYSKVDDEWSIPSFRAWYERLTKDVQLTRFDLRGCGLSDRPTTGIGLDGWLRDLEAVVAALGVERVGLIAFNQPAQIALAYAARHPEDVHRAALVLPILTDDGQRQRVDALVAISQTNHRLWAETMAEWMNPASSEEEDQLTRLVLASVSPEMQPLFSRAMGSIDVSDELAKVTAPVLVIDSRDNQFAPGMAHRLAAAIPGASLKAFDERPGLGFLRSPVVADAVVAFLSDDDPATGQESVGAHSTPSLRTLLFTDLESSTAFTQALGDAKAQEVLHGHNAAVRAALAAHNGDEVKHTGDGIFAAFGSAVSAVEAALQIQRDLAGAEVRVRIGLNAGEPIAEDDDYFGTAVQLAARVCDRAEPGQVLVSRVVHDLCAGKGFDFTDQGEATLKGFPEPVRLFVVREHAPMNTVGEEE